MMSATNLKRAKSAKEEVIHYLPNLDAHPRPSGKLKKCACWPLSRRRPLDWEQHTRSCCGTPAIHCGSALWPKQMSFVLCTGVFSCVRTPETEFPLPRESLGGSRINQILWVHGHTILHDEVGHTSLQRLFPDSWRTVRSKLHSAQASPEERALRLKHTWGAPTSDDARYSHSFDPDDLNDKETFKNARRKLERPMAPVMPCKKKCCKWHHESVCTIGDCFRKDSKNDFWLYGGISSIHQATLGIFSASKF